MSKNKAKKKSINVSFTRGGVYEQTINLNAKGKKFSDEEIISMLNEGDAYCDMNEGDDLLMYDEESDTETVLGTVTNELDSIADEDYELA